MKLWSLQPHEVADSLLAGKPYICDPKLSPFFDQPDFSKAYKWLTDEMELTITRPPGVILPAWAWFKNYGANVKPDRRRGLFMNYGNLDVILELEVPESDTLLSDFDDWHCVLNDFEIVSDEEFEADEDRIYTHAEKLASWQQVFDVDDKEFVQACIWQIKPEHLVKVHKFRNKKS